MVNFECEPNRLKLQNARCNCTLIGGSTCSPTAAAATDDDSRRGNYFAAILMGFFVRGLIEFGEAFVGGSGLRPSLGCCVHGPTLIFVGLKVIRFPRANT